MRFNGIARGLMGFASASIVALSAAGPAAADKDVKVIISADQQIDYQEVSDLVDAIRKAGISNFALDVMRID